mgnify:CR=1 FL=1
MIFVGITISKTIAAVIILIPVILQFAWQMENHQLPVSDAADHFRMAYLIYLAFQDGFTQGVHFIFHNSGKPILFSAFAAPLIPLYHINELLPVAVFVLIVQTAISLSYFWLFLYKLDPLRSAILAVFITTSPYLFSSHNLFMSETVWHIWFILFLATLLRSENLKIQSYALSSGIFLGLTILARPAESIFLISPALLVYFIYLYKEKTIEIANFLNQTLLFLLLTSICFLISWFSWPTEIGLVIIALVMSIYFLKKTSFQYIKKKKLLFFYNKDFFDSWRLENLFLPVSVMLSTWLLFYGRQIFFWSYAASFGTAATANDQVNLSRNIFLIFYDLLNSYGMLFSVVSISVACFLLAFSKKTDNEKKNLQYAFLALSGMLLPMLFAYSITGTSDNRRILIGMVFLFLCASFYANKKAILIRNIGKIILIIFSIIMIIQCFAVVSVITQNNFLIAWKKTFESYVGPLIYRHPGVYHSHGAEVIREIMQSGVKNCRIAVFSLGMFTKQVFYDAESLRYITLAIDPTLDFGTLWAYTRYEPYLDVVKRLKANGFKYVLLEDLDNPIDDPVRKEQLKSHTFFVNDILEEIRKNGENNIFGLDLVRSFHINGRKQYLFKVSDSHMPKITASSQLDSFSPDGLLEAAQPGWHAARHPNYPQTITIDFITAQWVEQLHILPQDQNEKRMPRIIEIKVSDNEKDWVSAGSFDNLCLSEDQDRDDWRSVKIMKPVKSRYLQIKILANCGDPVFLTFRGLKIN